MTGILTGRAALITGAGSGMGRAMAHLFSQEGARVALVDRDGEAVEAVAQAIRDGGGWAKSYHQDLAERDALPGMVADAVRAMRGLDIVVNNAGLSIPVAIDNPSYLEKWDLLQAVLLDAPMLIVHSAVADLRQSSAPRILNIASTEGLGATALQSPYSAAKAGLIGLTRSLAVELGKEGITVNCICPGPIDTGIVASISEADREVFARRRTALRRYGKPEEVAAIALSFCSPAASYLTGAIVPVDGGLMARNA